MRAPEKGQVGVVPYDLLNPADPLFEQKRFMP
jgi:hypothetical protein